MRLGLVIFAVPDDLLKQRKTRPLNEVTLNLSLDRHWIDRFANVAGWPSLKHRNLAGRLVHFDVANDGIEQTYADPQKCKLAHDRALWIDNRFVAGKAVTADDRATDGPRGAR